MDVGEGRSVDPVPALTMDRPVANEQLRLDELLHVKGDERLLRAGAFHDLADGDSRVAGGPRDFIDLEPQGVG